MKHLAPPTHRRPSLRPPSLERPTLAALAAIVALLLAGCGGSGRTLDTASPGSRGVGPLLGSAGERLVKVVDGRKLAPTRGDGDSALAMLKALTFDPESGTFFGLAQGEHGVTLVAFDGERSTTPRVIGPLAVPRMNIRIAEAITWDAERERLLVAASRTRHTPISNLLLAVDPATAKGKVLAEIEGSEQNEADALVMAGSDLLMVDNIVGRARLFRLDPRKGTATPLGGSFEPVIDDLAWDPESGLLLGLSRDTDQLLALEPDHQADARPRVMIGVVHPQAGPLVTLASASRRPPAGATGWQAAGAPANPDDPELFGDDFESGTVDDWSASEGDEGSEQPAEPPPGSGL